MIIPEQRRKDLACTLELYKRLYSDFEELRTKDFKEYNVLYMMTNEQLNDIWHKRKQLGNCNALSVLASGDQAFNLINKGVLSIDTYDINRLTEYYALGFKKTAIETLSFMDFLNLFDRYDLEWNSDLEREVIKNMPDEYRWFWQEFLYSAKDIKRNPSIFDLVGGCGIIDQILCDRKNNYLLDENEYKLLQENMKKAKITFSCCDIKEIPKSFGQYNIIYLSNILDYYKQIFRGKHSLQKAYKLLTTIYMKNLKDSGEIFLTNLTGDFRTKLFLDNPEIPQNKYYDYLNELIATGIPKGKALLKTKK
ncbi:MAG: hypothetical protein IJO33_04600 [Bacilli bacterium]|nr:hypothetical protein [Bacilli bacterium]